MAFMCLSYKYKFDIANDIKIINNIKDFNIFNV